MLKVNSLLLDNVQSLRNLQTISPKENVKEADNATTFLGKTETKRIMPDIVAAIKEFKTNNANAGDVSPETEEAIKVFISRIDSYAKVNEKNLDETSAHFRMLQYVAENKFDLDKTPMVTKTFNTNKGPIFAMVYKKADGKCIVYAQKGLKNADKIRKNPEIVEDFMFLKNQPKYKMGVYWKEVIENLPAYYAKTH